MVASNRVNGNLQRQENRTAHGGSGNTIVGNTEDQCTRLQPCALLRIPGFATLVGDEGASFPSPIVPLPVVEGFAPTAWC